ncbi:MAG: hypothetical protein R6U31_02865 [bacterium]
MKTLILFLSCLTLFLILTGSNSPYKEQIDREKLHYIRTRYYAAIEDPAGADSLYHFIENEYGSDYNDYNPIVRAYYACLIGLKGKFNNNPYTKYKYVNDGIRKIDSAVSEFEYCMEIRFLRFSFYHYLPDLFGIDRKREQDRQIITDMFKKQDYTFVPEEIQADMIEFTINTGRLEKDASDTLKTILKDLRDDNE